MLWNDLPDEVKDQTTPCHDDVIKWKHFPRYWPFVRGIHRSPVNSPHKGQWRGALMFSWICIRINGWVNNGEAGDLRRHRGHYDVTLMYQKWLTFLNHLLFYTCQDSNQTMLKHGISMFYLFTYAWFQSYGLYHIFSIVHTNNILVL